MLRARRFIKTEVQILVEDRGGLALEDDLRRLLDSRLTEDEWFRFRADPNQSAREQRCAYIADGRPKVEIFTLGLSHPWGQGGITRADGSKVLSTCRDKHRTLRDFLEHDRARDSIFGYAVMAQFPADRVIFLSCEGWEDHLTAGRDDPHLGFHPRMVQRLVYDKSGLSLQNLFKDLFIQMRAKPLPLLQQGLAVVPWCTNGKHRSNAASSILVYCWNRDKWNLHSLEVIPLARLCWSWRMCDGVGNRCEHCSMPHHDRDAQEYDIAWQYFLDAKRDILG